MGTVVLLSACTRAPEPPQTFGSESNASLQERFGCIDVMELQESSGTYKVLVFKLPKASESDSDYRLVFYRKDGATFRRHGAEQNLVNFQRPVLAGGSQPRIETVENRLGVKFHYQLTHDDVQFVPSEGTNDNGSLKGHPATR
ncbi:hypothetical protein BO221_06455 [Archangium sp. Cb G35]|nr:hypothetical protein BO221_06455 [Archangium sp. Cb G35]